TLVRAPQATRPGAAESAAPVARGSDRDSLHYRRLSLRPHVEAVPRRRPERSGDPRKVGVFFTSSKLRSWNAHQPVGDLRRSLLLDAEVDEAAQHSPDARKRQAAALSGLASEGGRRDGERP